jgi:NodT family efflux transporter outer membrane factor (OMF) lipoprotein
MRTGGHASHIVAATIGLLLLAGCGTVGPDHAAPNLPVPARYGEAQSDVSANDAELARWWQQFGDPTLDRLVVDAVAANLDLREAESRIREARAREIVAGAANDPQLGAVAETSRTRLSENAGLASNLPGGVPTGGVAGLPGSSFSTFKTGFDASWEIDLWGGTRRAVEGARARTEAEAWSARDLRVALVAEVARHYFDLRLLQQRRAIAAETLERQRGLEALLEARARNGLISRLEVEQQGRQTERAAAALPPLDAEARVQVHAIAFLLDRYPEGLDAALAAPAAAANLPPTVPAGLPSDLLRRRPDIVAAERRLAASTADIGVAIADLYPRFSLTGALSLVSSALTSLVSADSLQAMIGGAVHWPLLDGGRGRANVAVARERRAQALIGYERAVLGAFRDVEDMLARCQREQQRQAALERAAADARAAVATARSLYGNGLTPFLDVLESESALLQAEEELAESRAQRTQDLVALYKALGGGWEMDSPALDQEEDRP